MEKSVLRAVKKWAREHRGDQSEAPDVVFHEYLKTRTQWRKHTVTRPRKHEYQLVVRSGRFTVLGAAVETSHRTYRLQETIVGALGPLAEPNPHFQSAVLLLLDHLLENVTTWARNPYHPPVTTQCMEMEDGSTYTTHWLPEQGLALTLARPNNGRLAGVIKAHRHRA
jgi:hypothetical protein